MAYNKSKSKGSSYERHVAKLFSQWWCNDEKSIYRVTGSGSRKSSLVYGGDLQPANDTATPWHLCVEVKKSEQWSLEGFVNQNPGEPLLMYMLQCLSSAELGCNKVPVLICAKNYKKPLVFLRHYAGIRLHSPPLHRVPFLARLVWRNVLPEKLLQMYHWDGLIDFDVLYLDAFFTSFHREDFL